jgi:predicted acyl esterase
MTVGVETVLHLSAIMRDGVRLGLRLYRPRGSGPLPVVLTLTPYGMDRFHADAMHFARAGFAFVIADCRGRGESDGVFDPSAIDAVDGHDAVTWLATQDFCDGRVVLWGGSYAGENQWHTACTQPGALRAIAPAAATQLSQDTAWRGPVRLRYGLKWYLAVGGRSFPGQAFADDAVWLPAFRAHHAAGAAFADLPGYTSGQSAFFAADMAHPPHDPWWHRFDLEPSDFAALTLPVLTITGQYDDALRGALAYVLAHERHGDASRHDVLIGPWDHAGTRSAALQAGGATFGPAAAVDLRRLTQDWYAHVLHGQPRPAFLRDRVGVYLTGAEDWVWLPSLNALGANRFTLPLSGERLGPGGGPLSEWLSDPAHPDLNEVAPFPEGLTDARDDTAPGGARFDSAPLSAPLRLAGWPRLELWVETDLPDADLVATLSDVSPDGIVLKLSQDMCRLRYHAGLDHVAEVPQKTPFRVTFDRFNLFAREVAAGHMLRLTVRTVNSIHCQRNFQGGGAVDLETITDARKGTIRVWHNTGHPATLDLPLLQKDPR